MQYWREACYLYNEFCPLHCLNEGIDFCHGVSEHIAEIEEQHKKSKRKEAIESDE